MRVTTAALLLVLWCCCANAAPRIWLEHTDVPEALMVSNDTGAEIKGCKVEWKVRYEGGDHYTEIALVDLPANGEVKVSDCAEWWDESRSKTLDVDLALYDPDGKELAANSYEGVFKVVPRQGIPTDDWTAQASRGANTAAAFDADLDSRWDTGGRQEAGDWYTLDMHRTHEIAGLVIDSRRSANDYPSGLTVEVSTTDDEWTRVVALDDTEPLNRRGRITLSFDAVAAQRIRITLTKPHGEHWFWSIHELSVLPPKNE